MNVYDDSYRDMDPYLQPNLALLPGLLHYHKAVISLVAQMAKSLHYNAGDPGSIPDSGRYPGEGNGNPHQYSYLENYMDSGRLPSMGLQRVRHDQMSFTYTKKKKVNIHILSGTLDSHKEGQKEMQEW